MGGSWLQFGEQIQVILYSKFPVDDLLGILVTRELRDELVIGLVCFPDSRGIDQDRRCSLSGGRGVGW